MDVRVATTTDVSAVTATIASAFADDPIWGWVFPESGLHPDWWQFVVEGAVPQGRVRTTMQCEAVAVWIPPGGAEFTPEDEHRIGPLVRHLVGDRNDEVMDALDTFDAAHPREVPHYYLSLLATHEDHRGRGIGMALLAENLERIDEEHAPAYLESSNPANLARYERVGFTACGEFTVPVGGQTVTMMWREPR